MIYRKKRVGNICYKIKEKKHMVKDKFKGNSAADEAQSYKNTNQGSDKNTCERNFKKFYYVDEKTT